VELDRREGSSRRLHFSPLTGGMAHRSGLSDRWGGGDAALDSDGVVPTLAGGIGVVGQGKWDRRIKGSLGPKSPV